MRVGNFRHRNVRQMLGWRNLSRDILVSERVASGESVSALAKEYGLTRNRIYQIVKSQRKRK